MFSYIIEQLPILRTGDCGLLAYDFIIPGASEIVLRALYIDERRSGAAENA